MRASQQCSSQDPRRLGLWPREAGEVGREGAAPSDSVPGQAVRATGVNATGAWDPRGGRSAAGDAPQPLQLARPLVASRSRLQGQGRHSGDAWAQPASPWLRPPRLPGPAHV